MSKTINVVVSTKSSGGMVHTAVPVTLKNTPTLGGGVTRFDKMNDVDPTGEVDGAVPVYNAATDKYIVKRLDLTNVIGDLDGGEF